jgi:hypothetical protein
MSPNRVKWLELPNSRKMKKKIISQLIFCKILQLHTQTHDAEFMRIAVKRSPKTLTPVNFS